MCQEHVYLLAIERKVTVLERILYSSVIYLASAILVVWGRCTALSLFLVFETQHCTQLKALIVRSSYAATIFLPKTSWSHYNEGSSVKEMCLKSWMTKYLNLWLMVGSNQMSCKACIPAGGFKEMSALTDVGSSQCILYQVESLRSIFHNKLIKCLYWHYQWVVPRGVAAKGHQGALNLK